MEYIRVELNQFCLVIGREGEIKQGYEQNLWEQGYRFVLFVVLDKGYIIIYILRIDNIDNRIVFLKCKYLLEYEIFILNMCLDLVKFKIRICGVVEILFGR